MRFQWSLGRDVFTVGQIAKLWGTSPRTVTTWIDKGRLTGYRINAGINGHERGDRRVTRRELIRFALRERLPLRGVLSTQVVLTLDGVEVRPPEPGVTEVVRASDLIDAALSIDWEVGRKLIFLDTGLGQSSVLRFGRSTLARDPAAFLAAVLDDDVAEAPFLEAGFRLVVPRPGAPVAVRETLERAFAETA
jgi:hypothetical protein